MKRWGDEERFWFEIGTSFAVLFLLIVLLYLLTSSS